MVREGFEVMTLGIINESTPKPLTYCNQKGEGRTEQWGMYLF